jgi:signal transduction histidine kinase
MVDRPRILVVANDVDMNRFVSDSLSTHGEVIQAFNGRDGLEQAQQFRPTLVVIDTMMPDMNGIDMIDEIRKLADLQSTPILLLSDKADEDLLIKLLDEGAQDFIVKPFSKTYLTVRVRNLLQAEQAREEAEEATRAKHEFLAMLGHELRNPLSPIVTALQLMKLGGADSTERARTIIERQVNHLMRLVDDLLDVSRIARGRVELKTEILEMSDIVAKAIEIASPMLEQHNHVLTVSVPRRGLQVDGDPTRLSQVVSNLLTNAAKYTPPGGRIEVRADHVDDEIVLRVRDTGIGIPPHMLPRVFDLFAQERQAIDRSQGGLGIGLTIVRNLVERHGGRVSADSDGPGCGSEFTVRLPRVKHTNADAGNTDIDVPAVDPISGGGARVLVVDDNQDGAEMLAAALDLKGFETRLAYDASTALRVAAEFQPAVAFLDIGLPVMDGYELASHLREIPGLATVRLIAVTGYGQEPDRQRTRDAGFDHHLIKPVDITALESAVAPSDVR